jgi:hypothetical protein
MPKEHGSMGKRNPRLTITDELHNAVKTFLQTIVDMHGQPQIPQGSASAEVTPPPQQQQPDADDDNEEDEDENDGEPKAASASPPKPPQPVVFLPQCMSKRNLYEAWIFQRGWDCKADDRGVYPKVAEYPVRKVAEVPFHASKKGSAPLDLVGLWTSTSKPLEVCGWNAWQIEWKRWFPHVRTTHPQGMPPSLDPNVATPQTDLIYIQESDMKLLPNDGDGEAARQRFPRIFAASHQRRSSMADGDGDSDSSTSSVSSDDDDDDDETKDSAEGPTAKRPRKSDGAAGGTLVGTPVKRGRGRPKGSVSKAQKKKLKKAAKKRAKKEEKRVQLKVSIKREDTDITDDTTTYHPPKTVMML